MTLRLMTGKMLHGLKIYSNIFLKLDLITCWRSFWHKLENYDNTRDKDGKNLPSSLSCSFNQNQKCTPVLTGVSRCICYLFVGLVPALP